MRSGTSPRAGKEEAEPGADEQSDNDEHLGLLPRRAQRVRASPPGSFPAGHRRSVGVSVAERPSSGLPRRLTGCGARPGSPGPPRDRDQRRGRGTRRPARRRGRPAGSRSPGGTVRKEAACSAMNLAAALTAACSTRSMSAGKSNRHRRPAGRWGPCPLVEGDPAAGKTRQS